MTRKQARGQDAAPSPDATPNAPISRRIGPNRFETRNPEECRAWLVRLGWHDVPRSHRTEVARLTLAGWTASIRSSGLVVMLPPQRDEETRRAA